MQLTEEQIQDREQFFIEMLDFIAENYIESEEEVELTEEDEYLLSILMDYFVENYKIPSLKESAMVTLTDEDINDALFEEILETILFDESFGSAVATAVYGLRSKLAAHRSAKATAKEKKARQVGAKASQATKAAQKAADAAPKTGLMGAFKTGYHSARVSKLANKAAKKHTKYVDSRRASAAAATQARKMERNRGKLADRIDTGISNIKNKAKNIVKAGASKVGSAVGRFA